MDKEVEESINKFEFKKEFREVKLKTRESFREDQAALEKRLSKYRVSSDPSGNSLNKTDHSSKDVKKPETISALESIVMDVTMAGEKARLHSTGDSVSTGSNLSNDLTNGPPNGSVAQNGHANGHVNGSTNTITGYRHQMSDSSDSHTDGQPTPSAKVGNGAVPNGKPPLAVHVPRANGKTGQVVKTPELKTAAGRRLLGIYEKNPRLTSASTEHLDNISLKGYKNHSSHGSKIAADQRHNVVPSVQGAEVPCIPCDGNLASFSVEEMVTVFRLLNVHEDAIYRLHRGKVDGGRFARFSDKELSDIGIFNPVIRYFRDRSQHASKSKRKTAFML